MAKRFTQLFQYLVPSWLSDGDGGKVLHSLAAVKDKLVRRARLGLEARMPRRAGPSALALISADRGILRGRSETDAHYAERLAHWRYPLQHRVRGGAWALLDQIAEYLGGAFVYTLDASGNMYTRGVSLGFTYERDAELYEIGAEPPVSWGPLDSSHWSRFWVVLNANPGLPWIGYTPPLAPDDPTLWGGAVGTPGYCVGLTGWTPADTLAIRKLFRGRRQWRPAGTRAEWLCIRMTSRAGGAQFTPSDATWDRWAVIVGGVRTKTRSADFRYISLSPDVNNIFIGDPTQWADETYMPAGPNYAGNPANFSAAATLPGGTTYAGDPSKFTAAIQLFDDGDQT